MKNWNLDLTEIKKDKKQYTIWKLEQMVNFGLSDKKIKQQELQEYWPLLQLDPQKKKFLSLLLWKTLS